MSAVSWDCRDGLHSACAADGGCTGCQCHEKPTARPTHAQLATSADLLALAEAAEGVIALSLSYDDVRTLREIVTSTRALVALVDRGESWIGAARSHLVVAGPLVAVIRRRAEER